MFHKNSFHNSQIDLYHDSNTLPFLALIIVYEFEIHFLFPSCSDVFHQYPIPLILSIMLVYLVIVSFLCRPAQPYLFTYYKLLYFLLRFIVAGFFSETKLKLNICLY